MPLTSIDLLDARVYLHAERRTIMHIQTENLSVLKLPTPIVCDWKPETDITAYELALLLPYLSGKLLYESDWKQLGSASRHLARKDI